MTEVTSNIELRAELVEDFTSAYDAENAGTLFRDMPLGKIHKKAFLQDFYAALRVDSKPESFGVPVAKAEVEAAVENALAKNHQTIGERLFNIPTPGKVLDNFLMKDDPLYEILRHPTYQTEATLDILYTSSLAACVNFTLYRDGSWGVQRLPRVEKYPSSSLFPLDQVQKDYEMIMVRKPDETIKSFNNRVTQFSDFLLKELKAAPGKKNANQEIFWKNMETYIPGTTLEQINGTEGLESKKASKETSDWGVEL